MLIKSKLKPVPKTNPLRNDLKFIVLSLDKKGNEYDGIIVSKQKIQSLNKDSSLYIVNFANKMTGIDPVTGKKNIRRN